MIASSVTAAQTAYSQWQTWLAQPAQVAARQQSQTAFGQESASQALNTDMTTYPGWIGQAGYQSLNVGGQAKVVGTPDKYSASVRNSDGSRGVMVSPSPLAGTTPSGASAPVDLTFASNGAGSYQPQSSLVPVTVPLSSTGQLSLTQQGIGVKFATGTAVAGQQQGGTVFYANVGGVGSDTDVVVNAIPSGAEVSYVLRSANSPQSQTLTFTLPAGWSLAPSVVSPQTVEVVDGSGTPQLNIPPATAMDAQGQSVPVSYQIQGNNQLVMSVADQGGNYAFPIDVDPVLSVGNNGMFNLWHFWTTNASNFNILQEYNNNLGVYDTAGLQVLQLHNYTGYPGAGFNLFAPSYANIYEFDLTGITHVAYSSEFLMGLQSCGSCSSNTTGWVVNSTSTGSLSNFNIGACLTGCTGNGTYDGDQAAFGLMMTGGTPAGKAQDWATGGHVYFTDNNPVPVVSFNSLQYGTPDNSSNPVAWWAGLPASWLSVGANTSQSNGLGVQSVTFQNASNGNAVVANGTPTGSGCSIVSSTVGCSGISSVTGSIYAPSSLVNGINEIVAVATGYDGQSSSSTDNGLNAAYIGIDPNTPTLTGSGNITGGGITAVGAGTIQLTGSESQQTSSGIANVEAFLDGNPNPVQLTGSLQCGGGKSNDPCSVTPTYTPSPSAGWHQLTADAWNWAGTESATYTDNFAEVGAPTISANTGYQVGDTLTATPAAFSTNQYESSVPSVAGWQWQSCDVTGVPSSCVNIPGATGNQYTLTGADVGSTISVTETVNSPSGTSPSTLTISSGAQRSTPVQPFVGPSCNDYWTGAGGDQEWGDNANWSAGVPQSGSSSVACIRSGYGAPSVKVEPYSGFSGAASALALDAYGASIVVHGGDSLTTTETSSGSGVGNLTLGDSSGAGSLDAVGPFTVQGVPGSQVAGLNWGNGTISGSTVTLTGTAVSQIAPTSASASLILSGASLVNNGTTTMVCTTANDSTNALTELIGEGAAVLHNQGTMTFTGTSGAGDGCEFQQATAGSGTAFINGGTISEQNITAVDIGWPFESDETATVKSTSIGLYGGQNQSQGHAQPISGHWTGSSALNFEAGGPYSLTDDLADFGSQSTTTTNVTVEPAPGGSGGTTVAFAKCIAGLSGSPTAPAATIAGGTWTYGTVTADGPLTIGQGGSVTTLGSLVDSGSAPITQAGPVDVVNWTSHGAQISNPSSYPWTVWGTTNITGSFNGTGTGSMTFYGPVNVSQTPSITVGGALTLLGPVSGTGNFTVSSGGAFYEQGCITSSNTVSIETGSDVQLSGAITGLGTVSITGSTGGGSAAGNVDISGSVDAVSLSVNAAQLTDEGDIGDAATLNSVSLTAGGAIRVGGKLSATNLTVAAGGAGTTTATLDSPSATAGTLTANGVLLYNEGTLAIGTSLFGENGSVITNDGTINANGATFNTSTQGPVSTFVNAAAGQLADPSSNAAQNTILLPYSGSTPNSPVSGGGTVSAAYLINGAGANQYGGNNPAAPNMVDGACDQAADCGNGDWSTSETDMTVTGLGGPLALTRQYSSRLAASEQTPGMFGYGWITPFDQRLYVDSAAGTVTVQTTTGSQATFTAPVTNGYYTPTSGIWATLHANSGGTYTYMQPDGTTTAFNAAGLPTSVTNRQGQQTNYTYNTQNQLTSVTAPTTDGAGRSITFQYIASGPGTGLVGTATDPDGLQFTYSYDNLNNLRTVTESAAPGTGGGTSTTASPPASPMWSYCYDGPVVNCSAANDTADLHELTSLTDANSNATTITYQAGYVTGVQQPGATSAESWSYTQVSPGVGKTTQTSPATPAFPNGNQTLYFFNSKDEPTQTQYADGTTVNMTYNSNGDLTGEQNGARLGSANTDCNGATGSGWTCYGYDSAGNQTSERNPDGNTTYWTYNLNSGNPLTNHDLLTEKLPSGETTTYNADAGGQPLSVSVSNPTVSGTPTETTTMTYYPDEQLKTKQTPLQLQNNTQSTYTYDSYGDLMTVTSPATADFTSGTVTTYGYDLDGREICQTTPIVTAADTAKNPSQCGNSTLPGANPSEPQYAATSIYDGLGDLMSATNPQSSTTYYTYSAAQQVVQETTPSSSVTNVTSYLYCPNGQLEQTTIGNGTGTPALTEANTYDNDNNLTSQTTGASTNGCTNAPTGGRTYTYTYNNMNQLLSETPPSGLSSEVTSYTYDGDGNVKTITYPANTNGTIETTTYGYTGEDQKDQVTYSDLETQVVKTYTQDGQVATMSDATGDTSYVYDGLDRLSYVCVDGTSFTSVAGTCPSGRPISYGYNSDNDQTSIGYPNGQPNGQQFVQQQFTAMDQLANVTDWNGNKTSFQYDADGNLLTTNFPSGTGETDTYQYNLDNAMTGVTMSKTGQQNPLASITLTPYADDLINKAAQTGLPSPACDTYTYTQQQELASDTPVSSGSCPTPGTTNYSYDSARNMTQLNGTGTTNQNYNTDSELTSGAAGTYAYNPIGERKSFTPTSGTGSTYTYNANENLTQATVAGTTLTYTYDGNGQLQSRKIGSSTQALTWDDTQSTPNLLAQGTNQYYIYGPGGNAIEQISGTGTVQYLHQDQIGSTRLITSSSGAVAGSFTYSPYGALLAKTGSATTDLGYAGQYTDEKSGFQYDQARWYDPVTGQFMAIDPKTESTWQPYAYADGNPVSETDPTGLSGVTIGTPQQIVQRVRYARRYCQAHPGSCRDGLIATVNKAVTWVAKHPGTALEIGVFAAQFVPGADVVVAVIGGAARAALLTYGTAQTLNMVTGHFTVGSALVDLAFSFPAGFPALAKEKVAEEILTNFGNAVGATGVGIGILADQKK